MYLRCLCVLEVSLYHVAIVAAAVFAGNVPNAFVDCGELPLRDAHNVPKKGRKYEFSNFFDVSVFLKNLSKSDPGGAPGSPQVVLEIPLTIPGPSGCLFGLTSSLLLVLASQSLSPSSSSSESS